MSSVSSIDPMGGNGAIQLTRTSSDPHFQGLQLERVGKAASTPEEEDPNWLLLGVLGIGIVVFTAVPPLWLVAIVALDHLDRSTQDNGGAIAKPSKNSVDSSSFGGITLTTDPPKKKKKNIKNPFD